MNRIVFEDVKDIDLKHIFECGQCFRWNDEEGNGSYVGIAGGHICHARLEGGTNYSGANYSSANYSGNLILDVSGGDREFWSDYFDLETSYGDIKARLVERDPSIKKATDECGGIRILNQDFWEVLISFIISQNNNIPRIKGCVERMCEAYGEPIGEYLGKMRYAFPTPERIRECCTDDFACMRFGYRSSYLPKAAEKYLAEGVPSGSQAEKRNALISYLGVGSKVANCVMLFGLREFSAFPIDTWVKKIMADMYDFDESDLKGMQRFAEEKFGEYGGYAQQYLFYLYRG